jgi:hypothetical protein
VIKEIDEPSNSREKPTKPGAPPLSARKKKITISTAMMSPIRGGEHKTHGIYIGGGKIGDDWKRNDDSSDDDITSDDEGSVELDTFALYYDYAPIVNQTKEKQEHKMGKEQEDSHRTWKVVTYLFTLMLAGVACTTAGIQWGLGTMKNALVRVLFEPI